MKTEFDMSIEYDRWWMEGELIEESLDEGDKR